MVYLTSGYPTYFGFEATKSHNTQFGMIRIDQRKLDQSKLYPDEDFIAYSSGLVPAEFTTREQKIQ